YRYRREWRRGPQPLVLLRGDGRAQSRGAPAVGIPGRARQPPEAGALRQCVYPVPCARRPVDRNGAEGDRRPVPDRGSAETRPAAAAPGGKTEPGTPAAQTAQGTFGSAAAGQTA